ncbi:hypothetical protein RB595_009332 [Gaeumannomyces hyphopodioides]
MNNVGMANMGPMGGPVGAPMPMMNNGSGPSGPQKNSRTLLNTYIYEYFLRFEMYDCARAVLNSDPQLNVKKDKREIRDENGNITTNGLGDDPMDTDSKDDIEGKRPDDLPAPSLPTSQTDSCFLYEWFCIFWDILNAQKGNGAGANVKQYVGHTQAQNRMRQQAQQDMLRNMRTDMSAAHQQQQQMMMRGMTNGAMGMMGKGNLQRAAMANNQNPQMQMLAHQNKGQMQRDPSDMDGNRQRPGSPNSTDNAPSPSKRARLDAGPFNPNQPGMLPNGRPAGQGMPGQQTLQNSSSPAVQTKTIQTYAQTLQQHHGNQMPNKSMPNAGGPQGQGSPMVPGGPDSTAINAYYNAGDMTGGSGMRPGAPGGAGGSNHALQDYQMQLMLLEQQNKKRLLMARQEQDGSGTGMPRPDGPGIGPGGPGGPGGPPGAPNAQPFQGASPQGARPGASPNPNEMKRAGQINNGNMGSPLPEGAQNRESPNPMSFVGNQMDPNNAPHFFNKGMNEMNGNMVAVQMNGMARPPSSHPGQAPFNAMNPAQQQMMVAARQQLAAQQQAQQQAQQAQQQQQPQQQPGGPGGPPMQWQGGPNGNPMPGGPQGGPQQGGPQGQHVHGTPQQRAAMPPPPTAAANSNANQRNQTASPQVSTAAPPTPQQGNKPGPKKKDSKAKDKKKSNANLNAAAGSTPAADAPTDAEPPTPATPITPMATQSFGNKGQNPGPTAAPVAQPLPNGQPPAGAPATAPPVAPPQHADPNQFGMADVDFGSGMDFANPITSADVLTDFDFDTFLHDNSEENGFDFSSTTFGMESANEIGAE